MVKQEFRSLLFKSMPIEQYEVVRNAMAVCQKQCRREGQEPNENRLIELICLDYLSGAIIINE